MCLNSTWWSHVSLHALLQKFPHIKIQSCFRILVGISNGIVSTSIFTVEVCSPDLRGTFSMLESVLRWRGLSPIVMLLILSISDVLEVWWSSALVCLWDGGKSPHSVQLSPSWLWLSVCLSQSLQSSGKSSAPKSQGLRSVGHFMVKNTQSKRTPTHSFTTCDSDWFPWHLIHFTSHSQRHAATILD